MKWEKLSANRLQSAVGWSRPAAKVTAEEYLPFGAWIAAWAALTAAIGLHDAVLLLAANGFVQAIRAPFLMQSFDAISARLDCAPEARARARRLALRVDTAALVASVVILLAFAWGMRAIGLVELATMLLILSLGLPARTPAINSLNRRRVGIAWRLGSALALLAGATTTLLLELSWFWAALAVALREWGGLIGAWAVRRPHPPFIPSLPDLAFDEIASRTSFAVRRRLAYRLGKSALTVLGPLGSIVARTGRGSGLDRWLAERLPSTRLAFGLLAAGAGTAAVATFFISREPPFLLAASFLARNAAASAAVLIWWRWSDGNAGFEWLNDDI